MYEFECNLFKGIKANPKQFWKYVASQSKVKHAVGGPVVDLGGVLWVLKHPPQILK